MDSERVAGRRSLHPGDVIELGRGGPRFRVEWGSATVVAPMPAPSSGAVEGRTVMMSLQDASEGAVPDSGGMVMPPTGRVASRPPKKGKSRVLLVALLAFFVIVAGLVAAALLMRQANLKKKEKASVASAVTPPVAAPQAVVDESARIRQQIAEQAATLDRLQQTSAEGGADQATDLQRQLRESQQMIEELTHQLQQKNDQLANARTPVRRPAPRAAAPKPAEPVAVQPAAEPVPSLPTLINVKFLRKPVAVKALDPEIQSSQMPSGVSRDLATSLNTALLTTGKYIPTSKNGVASVTIAITNYKSEQHTGIDTKKVTRTADAVGSLFGADVKSSPVNVKSSSWDAAMVARVNLYDAGGRPLEEFQPAAESSSRKTTTKVSSLSFGEVFRSDTPAGDVAREVVAEALASMMPAIDRLEWLGNVTAQSKDRVVIDCGRVCQVEDGDYFDVLDGATVVGRIKVTKVEEKSSEAEVVAGSTKFTGHNIRYAGRESRSTLYGPAPRPKQLVMRRKAAVYDGPGNSFNKLAELRGGTRLTYLYSVGFWALGTNGKQDYWVPIVHAEIRD